jgi:hypothetical protein
MKTTTDIRELTFEETRQVAGGLLPVIALGLNLLGRVVVHQLAQHAIRSAGLVGASYGTAAYLNGDR